MRLSILLLLLFLPLLCFLPCRGEAQPDPPGPSAPVIFNLTPSQARQRQRLTVVIDGSGFVPGATVDFGPGVAVLSAVVSAPRQRGIGPAIDHILTVRIKIARRAPTGVRDVTVTNPDATSDTAEDSFVVNPRRRR